MKGYKGFNQDWTCQGFKYEVGKEYKHKGEIKLCERGFHFCEHPLDVLGYYDPTSRFAEVEGNEISPERDIDSKVVCSELHIKAEINLNSLIQAGVKFILEPVDWKNKKESNTGNGSAATNTGDRSAATNTGDRSAATNTGGRSAATNTGNGSAATNTGDRSAAEVSGPRSIACGLGIYNRAKGIKGCFLVLADWRDEETGEWVLKNVVSVKVDGKKIKENVWYELKKGKFSEVK
jgi:hypothetical protein